MVLKSFDQPTVLKPHELGVYNPSLYAPFTEIVCETGMLWVTRSGDLEDHVLMPGERLLVNQGGKVIIQAMREAQIRITSTENAN
jgi:hypothetical protein